MSPEDRPWTPGDLPLAQRIREGDRAAETEFAERFRRPVRAIALARTRNPAAADDLTQEILLSVLQALREGRLRHEERLEAFVHGVVRNRINSHFHGWRRSEDLADLSTPLESPLPSPEERFVHAERRALVRRALADLAPRDQEILLLTLVDGLTSGEIAARLGLKPEVLRKRKSRALRRVRAAVEEASRR